MPMIRIIGQLMPAPTAADRPMRISRFAGTAWDVGSADAADNSSVAEFESVGDTRVPSGEGAVNTDAIDHKSFRKVARNPLIPQLYRSRRANTLSSNNSFDVAKDFSCRLGFPLHRRHSQKSS